MKKWIANVFNKNLEVNIDNNCLNNMYSGFTLFFHAKWPFKKNCQSKGYGFLNSQTRSLLWMPSVVWHAGK
jgi:hypothetical protein